MEIRLAQPQDLAGWMELVEKIRFSFPGLETLEAMEAHRQTVHGFMPVFRRLSFPAVRKRQNTGSAVGRPAEKGLKPAQRQRGGIGFAQHH